MIDLEKEINENGVEIIQKGGKEKQIEEEGIKVKEV